MSVRLLNFKDSGSYKARFFALNSKYSKETIVFCPKLVMILEVIKKLKFEKKRLWWYNYDTKYNEFLLVCWILAKKSCSLGLPSFETPQTRTDIMYSQV